MRVYLLGTLHELQEGRYRLNEGDTWAELERSQKGTYRRLVRYIVESDQITFIGEEEQPGKSLYAASLGIEHATIDMLTAERDRVGIPKRYVTDPAVREERRAQYNRQREEYMVKRCLDLGRHHGTILVICGLDHVAALEDLFSALGHEIVAVRTVKQEMKDGKTWYELEVEEGP